MYDVGKIVLNTVLCFTTVWNIYRYLNTFFDRKKWNVLSIISWLVLIGSQVVIEFRDKQGNLLITFTIIVTILLVSINCYKRAGIKKFIFTIFLYVIWATVEVIVSVILEVIPLDQRAKLSIGEILAKIIMVMFVQIIMIFAHKDYTKNIPSKYSVFLLLVPLGSIYIILNQFLFMEQEKSSIFSLISYSIILIINIQIFEIYLKLIQFFSAENEKKIYENQLKLMTQKMEEQNKIADDLYRERHNAANELIVIKECIKSDDRKSALEILERVIQSGGKSSDISKSGNRIIDALINFKYVTVKDFGIKFSLKIFIPEKLSIDQRDLGIVIGNALDNAIEATKECQTEEKVIHIAMGIKKGAFVFVIRNPYEHTLIESEDGKFLSTKEGEIGHGYGLSSIRKIVDQYSGEMLLEAEKNIFKLTIIMNLQDFC